MYAPSEMNTCARGIHIQPSVQLPCRPDLYYGAGSSGIRGGWPRVGRTMTAMPGCKTSAMVTLPETMSMSCGPIAKTTVPKMFCIALVPRSKIRITCSSTRGHF